MSEDDSKRLFFGVEVKAAWPQELPPGRIIAEEMRHITLAFLGEYSFQQLKPHLLNIPRPLFHIGLAGIGTQLVFLPKKNARVVALDVTWLEDPHLLFSFQTELTEWLQALGYPLKNQPFYPHISIARSPFDREQWLQHFEPVPFFITALHLYESLGDLNYHSLWHTRFIDPFVELDHTADLAFEVRGESIEELFNHAQLALFFNYPQIAQFYMRSSPKTLDEVIIALNQIVTRADVEKGCPFKAVSFHGHIKQADNLLKWEMIVDV